MAIQTFTRSPGPFRAVRFDGSQASIDAVRELVGDRFEGVMDGTVILRMHNGEITLVKRGWAVYEDSAGVIAAVSEGVVATWTPA